MIYRIFLMAAVLLCCTSLHAERLEPIKFGDFQSWSSRPVKESAVIGGATKTIYEIGPTAKLPQNTPYRNQGGSPWATSNVYAKVKGVVKGSNAVFPHDRGGGNKCAKMQTLMEHVKVLGLLNMDVMVAGSIFLGQVFEPISSTSKPFGKMEMGIPYTKTPKALVFDYKLDMPATNTRVKATGFGSKKTLQGRDNAEVYILLQRRWEDEKGNLYAERVGTGRERYSRSTSGWVNGHRLPIHYGDITSMPWYKSWMGLLDGERAYYARNSKGKMVPVHETGWAPVGTQPTHMLMMASSSCGTPFVGTEGVVLYVDNFRLAF